MIGELQDIGVTPFLWAGTLLGAIREGDIITSDDDVDIAYMSKFSNPLDVEREMVDIYNKMDSKGLLYNYMNEWHQPTQGRPITSVFGQAHLGKINSYVDLFTMWVIDGDFYDPWFGAVAKDVDTTIVQDGATLRGVGFPTLKNPEWVLEMLYGDWKTPRNEKGGKRHEFRHTLRLLKGSV